MKFTDGVINRYGERLRGEYGEFRGFLSPIKNDAEKIPLPNGVKSGTDYRLITGIPVSEGMEIACRGIRYEVVRVQPVHAYKLISHYEAILREKGGVCDAQ